MADFIYITGPEGHAVRVDDAGRLLVNTDASTSGFVFGYGETGYPLAVDGNGRLLVNASGLEISLSGQYYEDDADLIPDSADTYNIGGPSDRFVTVYAASGDFSEGLSSAGDVYFDNIYAASGDFSEGIAVGDDSTDAPALRVESASTEAAVDIDNTGDAICLDLSKTTGSQPVIHIQNEGTGYDIDGHDTNWYITPDGAAEFTAVTISAVAVPQMYREELAGGLPVWATSGALYYADVTHSLGQQYVLAQYYNVESGVSLLVDHHEFIDTNTLRVFASTSGTLGVIITG